MGNLYNRSKRWWNGILTIKIFTKTHNATIRSESTESISISRNLHNRINRKCWSHWSSHISTSPTTYSTIRFESTHFCTKYSNLHNIIEICWNICLTIIIIIIIISRTFNRRSRSDMTYVMTIIIITPNTDLFFIKRWGDGIR